MSSASRFVPLLNRVLIEKIIPQQKTTSGILISKPTQTLPLGTVVAVNEGYLNANGVKVNPVLNVGEKVLLPEFGGTEIQLDGKTLHLFREDDILGVVNI